MALIKTTGLGTLKDSLLFDSTSKGIHLGVTTATASNLLDDYEEGTWTPTISTTSGSITVNSGTDLWYIKIGKVVHVGGSIEFSAISSPSGDMVIQSFPFVSATIAGVKNIMPLVVNGVGFASNLSGSIGTFWPEGTTGARLRDDINKIDSGDTMANHIDTGTTLYLLGTYLTD